MRLRTILFHCLVQLTPTLFAQIAPSEQPPDTLRIAYYASPPFVVLDENQLPKGVTPWLWDKILPELGIEKELHRMPLDSMLRSLASGAVDASLIPLSITSQRSETIDFSAPFYVAHSTLLTEQASSFQKGLQFVGAFFSLNFFRALGALFLVILAFGLLAWLFERRANPEEFHPGLKGIWSGIWWSAVTMTTVGYGDKSPRSLGGRIVALVWMFAAIIIISGFTAGIASSLTVNQLSWNLDEINQFKERPVATVAGSATKTWLERHFFKQIRPYPDLQAAVEALQAGEVEAVAYDEPALHYVVQQGDFEDLEIRTDIHYNTQLYALGFSEQLAPEIKERINNQLLKVVESTDWKVLLTEYNLYEE